MLCLSDTQIYIVRSAECLIITSNHHLLPLPPSLHSPLPFPLPCCFCAPTIVGLEYYQWDAKGITVEDSFMVMTEGNVSTFADDMKLEGKQFREEDTWDS